MSMMTKEINEDLAKRILKLVDAGLTKGLGYPSPGKMCVEAVICYALGESHDDNPSCVDPVLRKLKTVLNDLDWSTDIARAKGMRRLAIAQLGSRKALDGPAFLKAITDACVKKILPRILDNARAVDCLRYASEVQIIAMLREINNEGKRDKPARDKLYGDFAEEIVQILIRMNIPGCKFLHLTETK